MVEVLIVWQEIPDDLKLYQVTATPEEYAKLLECHGKLINVDLNNHDLVTWLLAYLETKTPNYSEGISEPINTKECAVVVTGFI